MLELDVEARQGDSGGPIFNQSGELAGVLFGAGQGYTMGSFAPRVRCFLAAVAPDIDQANSRSQVAVADRPPPVVSLPIGEHAQMTKAIIRVRRGRRRKWPSEMAVKCSGRNGSHEWFRQWLRRKPGDRQIVVVERLKSRRLVRAAEDGCWSAVGIARVVARAADWSKVVRYAPHSRMARHAITRRSRRHGHRLSPAVGDDLPAARTGPAHHPSPAA